MERVERLSTRRGSLPSSHDDRLHRLSSMRRKTVDVEGSASTIDRITLAKMKLSMKTMTKFAARREQMRLNSAISTMKEKRIHEEWQLRQQYAVSIEQRSEGKKYGMKCMAHQSYAWTQYKIIRYIRRWADKQQNKGLQRRVAEKEREYNGLIASTATTIRRKDKAMKDAVRVSAVHRLWRAATDPDQDALKKIQQVSIRIWAIATALERTWKGNEISRRLWNRNAQQIAALRVWSACLRMLAKVHPHKVISTWKMNCVVHATAKKIENCVQNAEKKMLQCCADKTLEQIQPIQAALVAKQEEVVSLSRKHAEDLVQLHEEAATRKEDTGKEVLALKAQLAACEAELTRLKKTLSTKESENHALGMKLERMSAEHENTIMKHKIALDNIIAKHNHDLYVKDVANQQADAKYSELVQQQEGKIGLKIQEQMQKHRSEVFNLKQQNAKEIALLKETGKSELAALHQHHEQQIAAITEKYASESQKLHSEIVILNTQYEQQKTVHHAQLERITGTHNDVLKVTELQKDKELEARLDALRNQWNAEVEGLKEQIHQGQHEVGQLKEAHASEIACMLDAHASEMSATKLAQQNEVTVLNQQIQAEHSKFEAQRRSAECENAKNVTKVEQQYADELTRLKWVHEDALSGMKSEHEQALALIEESHTRFIAQMEQEHCETIAELNHAHSKDNAQLQERHNQTLKELQNIHDMRMAETEHTHLKVVEKLRKDVTNVRTTNEDAIDRIKTKYESALRKLQQEKDDLQEQFSTFLDEYERNVV